MREPLYSGAIGTGAIGNMAGVPVAKSPYLDYDAVLSIMSGGKALIVTGSPDLLAFRLWAAQQLRESRDAIDAICAEASS